MQGLDDYISEDDPIHTQNVAHDHADIYAPVTIKYIYLRKQLLQHTHPA